MENRFPVHPDKQISDILQIPLVYDIVVSDFGRDAAIEYLHKVSLAEKEIIKQVLKKDGLFFFDEYRRIMFTVIADLFFFKQAEIQNALEAEGHFTKDILIGLGPSPMSEQFVHSVVVSVVQEVLAAINRGHQLIRIMIPCNTLSNFVRDIGVFLSSRDYLRELNLLTAGEIDKILRSHINTYTVAEAVIHHLNRLRKDDEIIRLLVLGTRDTNNIYSLYAQRYNMEVIYLEDHEYELIDATIVASIGDDKQKIEESCAALQDEIILPRSKSEKNMVVLEACTDFHLGLGLSSLEVFADSMLVSVYYSVLDL